MQSRVLESENVLQLSQVFQITTRWAEAIANGQILTPHPGPLPVEGRGTRANRFGLPNGLTWEAGPALHAQS
jgi:hypothetical protein